MTSRRRTTITISVLFAAALAAYASRLMTVPASQWTLVRSPNNDDRPDGTAIHCIVLHATVISTSYETVAFFLDRSSRVSAHFLVDKDGTILQLVPVEKRAWHAGISDFRGEPDVNNFSIGIEMVNRNDGQDPYPDAQFRAVTKLVCSLRRRYQIPLDCIVSHADVARPPGRKSDPRGFDLVRLRASCD